MGILRTDKISGLETPTAVTGSVEFDGNGDWITVPESEDFNFGTGDFTVEFWVYWTGLNSGSSRGVQLTAAVTNGIWIGQVNTTDYVLRSYGNANHLTVSLPLLEKWHHIAVTRKDSTARFFVNGNLEASGSVTHNFVKHAITIGSDESSGHTNGYISNVRMLKGTALYTSNFTPPAHELEVIGDTVLLCCNNPDSAQAEGTGKTITVNNDAAASTFSPGLTRDFTYGTEFKGVTTFDTQGYFVPPSGTTEQRYNDVAKNAVSASSARGLFGGGNTPTKVNTIEYITISTTGNGTDFGDLTNTPAQSGGAASNTRGIVAGGYDGSARTNVINYLTVATTGNAQNFGDLIYGRSGLGALSNTTRAVFSGGYGSAVVNTMDYVTISSTGDAQDFGDLLNTNNEMTGCASPTRGIFGSGDVPGDGTLTNTLQYITIATSGNTQDFGDLTIAADYSTGFSNSTRGIFYIGYTPNPASNIINFITISSTGNAVDFGDAYEKSGARSTTGASSSTRGVVAGGDSPAKSNSIEYVTIASLGNGQDFGALANFDTASPFGLSDGHGGLG